MNGWSLVLELILIFLVVKQTLGKKIKKKKGVNTTELLLISCSAGLCLYFSLSAEYSS